MIFFNKNGDGSLVFVVFLILGFVVAQFIEVSLCQVERNSLFGRNISVILLRVMVSGRIFHEF